MKIRLALGVLAVIVTVSVCAVAGTIDDTGGFEVLYKNAPYCVSTTGSFCPDFALWGPTAGGYVEFKDPGGTIDAYLWVDGTGELTFASGVDIVPPPAGLPLLGIVTEDGTLQEVDQFYPGGVTRPLFVESPVGTTPKPSTILLVGPAAVLLFNRARRFGRG